MEKQNVLVLREEILQKWVGVTGRLYIDDLKVTIVLYWHFIKMSFIFRRSCRVTVQSNSAHLSSQLLVSLHQSATFPPVFPQQPLTCLISCLSVLFLASLFLVLHSHVYGVFTVTFPCSCLLPSASVCQICFCFSYISSFPSFNSSFLFPFLYFAFELTRISVLPLLLFCYSSVASVSFSHWSSFFCV